MNNDDLWQLDGKHGPALPISEEAVHRLVGGAIGLAYDGHNAHEAPATRAKSGFTAGRRLFAGLGVGVAVCVVAGWAVYRADGARGSSAAAPAMMIETPAATTAASPSSPLMAEPMLSIDVQALPQAPSAPERSARANVGSPEASRDLLREANRLRAERRWDEAATLYRRVAGARSGESTTAMLALASLRLDHQNDAQEARRLYRAVVDAQPQGPLAEEARWGVAMACHALGEIREERAALGEFLANHPSSFSAPKAKRRLAELDSAREVTP